jgi:hypothetical protein
MKNILLIIISILTLSSCNKDSNEDNCIEYQTAYVTNVIAPTSGAINEELSIEAQFSVNNGCGNFSKFIEAGTGNSRTIVIQAKYEGCICTHAVETRNVNYFFRTQTPGVYEFKFKSDENEFIIVNITIE